MYSKFSFGEVYRHIYGRKFSLRRRASGAVKRDSRTYIRRYTSPTENFEYVYPHSNALLQFRLEPGRRKPHKAARHPRYPTKCGVIDDVNLFPAVYRRIYCRKFLTLSNQTSRHKSKCIRISNDGVCDGANSFPIDLNTNTLAKTLMSRGMLFPTMWHFDKCRLIRACAASLKA